MSLLQIIQAVHDTVTSSLGCGPSPVEVSHIIDGNTCLDVGGAVALLPRRQFECSFYDVEDDIIEGLRSVGMVCSIGQKFVRVKCSTEQRKLAGLLQRTPHTQASEWPRFDCRHW